MLLFILEIIFLNKYVHLEIKIKLDNYNYILIL